MQRTFYQRWFHIAFCAALLSGFGLYAWLNWQVLLDHQMGRVKLVREQVEHSAGSIFSHHMAVMEQLAAELQSNAAAGDDPGRLLRRVVAMNPGMLGAALADADGRLLARAGVALPIAALQEDPILASAFAQLQRSGEKTPGRTHHFAEAERWAAPVLVPLLRSSGELDAVLVAWFDVSPQGTLWRMINLLPETRMLLVDQDGYVKYSSDAAVDAGEGVYRQRFSDETMSRLAGVESAIFRMRDHELCEDCFAAVSRMPGYSHSVVILHSMRTAWRIYLQSMIAPSIMMVLLLVTVLVFFRVFYRLQHRYQEKLLNMAHYDSLTGLPNRVLAKDRLGYNLRQAKREDWKVAVLFLDLDNFKHVNDAHGHQSGDELLQMVATRLSANIKASDTVARLGGDEFVVILQHIQRIEDVELVAKRLIEAFRLPFHLSRHEVFCNTSVGIAVYPDDAETVEGLLQNADAAMYRAKESGKNNFYSFSRELTEHRSRSLTLATQLRYAVDKNELHLVYQPQYDLQSGEVVALEALCRWDNAVLGQIAPAEFIPAAEESGQIVRIGEWVLREACRARQELTSLWGESLRMSVNVSARQVREAGFRDLLHRILGECDASPEHLELEITESLLLDQYAREVLQELRADGFIIAVDDFGTGYAALSYLHKLPVSTLKIDRSFLVDFPENQESYALVNTIVFLANAFSLNIVAEGVENERQRRGLQSLGCMVGQGFGLCRPQPSTAFTQADNSCRKLVPLE